jgi:hypothetical protein
MPATSQSSPSPRLVQTVCLRFNAMKVRPRFAASRTWPPSHPFLSPDEDSSMSEDDDLQDSSSSSPDPILSDWFLNSHQSSLYLAEKTCEMVCYLWFSSNSPSSRRHHFLPHSSPHTASLQFSVSSHFTQFMQKVLETTQVSQSVIVLSLHYIYRLKERNRLTSSLPGSEFRVAIAALMMANKFVDEYVFVLLPSYPPPHLSLKQHVHEQDLVRRLRHSSRGNQQDGTRVPSRHRLFVIREQDHV